MAKGSPESEIQIPKPDLFWPDDECVLGAILSTLLSKLLRRDQATRLLSKYCLTIHSEPFTSLVRQTLRVNNYGKEPVAFKVKTTAPKLYCVRPNSGKVDAGGTVEVAVLLQPMKEDPPLSIKCKDKFLVQSTIIPPGMEPNDIWAAVSADKAIEVHQQKLKVVYLPGDGTLHEEDEPETHQLSVMTNDDSHRYETVRQGPGSGPAEGAAMAIPVFESGANQPPRPYTPEHAEFTNAPEHHDILPTAAPIVHVTPSNNTAVASSATPPRAPAADTHDAGSDHAIRLAEANAEINRLKALLERSNDQTLKRRTIFSEDGTSVQDGMTDGVTDIGDDGASVIGGGTMMGTKTEGVPLNVVAVLSVLVFVVTYLFF